MFGTYSGPSGDSQGTNTKTDDLMKKLFLEAIVLVLLIYVCFLQEEPIFKSSKAASPQDPVARRPGDQMMGRFRDVHGMLVKHDF